MESYSSNEEDTHSDYDPVDIDKQQYILQQDQAVFQEFVSNAAQEIRNNLLPKTSEKKYRHIYDTFLKWMKSENMFSFDEDTLLVYFDHLSKTKKGSTLWSYFSTLKTTIGVHQNIDIGKYKSVIAFVKRKNEAYVPKKAAVFQPHEIEKFLLDALDQDWLAMKVSPKYNN